ncbi:hypothetical protein C8Q76DRAFT_638697 [Earliella scabrosa]|nr:hypothetical protein C8Q76DRAFT_638697 [Earliella scabrosa]
MTSYKDIIGGLLEDEEFWRDRYDWFKQRGYTLRARYKPDWVPSWKGVNGIPLMFEDGLSRMADRVLDAVRDSDGETIVIKRVSRSYHPHEIPLGQLLCSAQLASDPRNHCCPVWDVLDDPFDPDLQLLVMPLLRRYNSPPMNTVGEAVAFFQQAFEGLLFMHERHIAHRDCMTLNIMLDPREMYPQLYHFVATDSTPDYRRTAPHYSRTRRPCKYYWTDFGLSRQYDLDNSHPLEEPILGGDRTVPEFQEDASTPRNPFHTDVYYLGNLIREDFLQQYTNLGFMHRLVTSMVNPVPDQRPTMEKAMRDLEKIVSQLPWWKLRARLRRRKDDWSLNLAKDVQHIFRAAFYLSLLPPLSLYPTAQSSRR